MKKSIKAVLFVTLLFFVVAGNYFLNVPSKNIETEYSKCRLSMGECEVNIGSERVTVSLIGEIKALQKFVVKISERGSSILGARVNFKMKAMDMGVNQYSLLKNSEGEWLADVVIPICTVGRRDWLVELDVLMNEKKKRVVFEINI